ncbi:MAG: Asp23/Gls24 family envelope stress response protein [Anaerolineae bacterium]
MEQNLGKVTIAPNVLVTIVQRTTTSVPGVSRLSDNVPGVQRLLGLNTAGQGVRVTVADGKVTVDVYLIARRNFDLLQMGRSLQQQVTRAIEDIVGMQVQEVNVHIDDVATELATDAAPGLGRERAA